MAPTDSIAGLSDRELGERLREYGIKVGPIVKSTRGLYEKKLRNFELGQVSKPKYEEVPDDDDDDEDEDEEEEEVEKYEEKPAPVSRSTRNEPRRRLPAMPAMPATPPRGKPVHFEEPVTTAASRQTRAAPPPTTKPKSKGFPRWIIVLVVLILVAVGYLVLQNMESAGENNIPNQIDAETV